MHALIGLALALSSWLGLFEGHQIAPPADVKRARAAVRAAQRLGVQCWEVSIVPSGGTQTNTVPCEDGARALRALGKDAAAAILDELDRPALTEQSFDALMSALAATERGDVVPVLVTALERMSARSGLGDRRVGDHGRDSIGAVERALTTLTYAAPNERATGEIDDARLAEIAKGWRAWLTAHPLTTREAWKSAAIKEAQRRPR